MSELISLKKFIEEERILYFNLSRKGYFRLPIYNGLKNCLCKPFQLSTYPFDDDIDLSIFTDPLIKMPLFINDENPEISSIAKWRLKLGR
jgi:hypothetical protein